MSAHALPIRRRAALLWLLVLLCLLTSAALFGAAVLVPAPPAVVPIVALFCIGGPLLAGLQLPTAIRALRSVSWTTRFRRSLEQLPETQHPLGL